MTIPAAARRLAKLLQQSGHKIVFAESCTGGLVSGALTKIPGISAYHCGSMVTYRNETKTAYLGIDPQILKRPGPVSEKVARLMVESVFEQTPEATVAASVTGHLGPNAPTKLDGLVFIGVRACREANREVGAPSTIVRRLRLPDVGREKRQRLAVEAVLRLVAEWVGQASSPANG
jgi:PncC family amidohydrolase